MVTTLSTAWVRRARAWSQLALNTAMLSRAAELELRSVRMRAALIT